MTETTDRTVDIVFVPQPRGSSISDFSIRIEEDNRTDYKDLPGVCSLPEAVMKADLMGLPPTHWIERGGRRSAIPSGIVRREPEPAADETQDMAGPRHG